MSDVVAAAIAAVRAEAIATFGWTHLAITARWDGHAWVLHGEVVARRWRDRVVAAIGEATAGAPIDARGVTPLRSDRAHALVDPCTPLHRGPRAPAALVTELVPDDGPVMWLAEHDGASLVRARDGTLGWIRGALGPAVALPRFGAPPPAADLDLVAAARPWQGVAYRLGGTTLAGIDCSALIQRLLRGHGIWLPRHSVDQVAIDPREGPGRGDPGDVLAVWAADESPCHVALTIAPDRVVHASRSRACVVIEPRAALLARVGRVLHVPFVALAALPARLVGAFALDEVLALGTTAAELTDRRGSADAPPRSDR